jgi:hypothetical protein
MKRRDTFIFVAKPGAGDEAKKYLGEWLRSLDGHPGYLGGAVLEEVAGELLPDTLVMQLEFESTEAARALWPKIENTVNPLYPDDKSDKSPDQGTAFFDGTKDTVKGGGELQLNFTRGNGLLARMLHIHAAITDEVSAAA